MNTVFSIFNYTTIGEFYNYLKEKNLVKMDDWYHSLYLAVHPSYYSAKSMPKELKAIAQNKANKFIENNGPSWVLLNNLVGDGIKFAAESDTWEENKKTFFMHTLATDKIRGERFFDVFPELNKLAILME
jgi:hypothetical protein